MATGSYAEIKAWQSDLDSLEKLNNMFLDVLDELAERKGDESSRSQEKKSTAEAVKGSRNRSYDFSKPFAQQIDDYRKGLIPKSDTLVIGGTPEIFKDIGFNALPMTINSTHIDYALYGTKDSDHFLGVKALKQLPQKIENPIAVFVSNTHETTSVIALLDFTVNGKQTVVPVVVDGFGKNNNVIVDSNAVTSVYGKTTAVDQLYDAINKESNNIFSLLYINKKEAMALLHRTGHQLSGTMIPHDGFYHSIRESNSPVKPKFNDVTETQQFKRWFGDWQKHPNNASKVVNPDGTPKVMYHGTTSSFTAFDKKKAKSSGFYGRGFYFTESESHAGQYGNAIAVYLDIKNPLEPGKNKVSKEQLRKFLEAVAENEDYDIWNYGTEDISEIVESVYKDDAFAVIQDVNATAIGNFAEALELFNEVNDTNFDGIITPTETVVYEPTQIKSATDNIGTFDKSNPDIRYSTKRDTDRKQSQFDVINAANPAPNSYSTWIRTVEDIKTLSETLDDPDWDYDEFNPDLTRADIQKAIRNGEITIYSSKPIENGVFVTPSRMEAENYSVDSKVYEKVVSIDDVAWIDPTQGQYAKVDEGQVDFMYARKRTPNLDPNAPRTPGKRLVESPLTNTSKINYNYEEHDPLSLDNRAMPNSRSSINWVYKAEIFSVEENMMFQQMLSEIKQGSKAFVQTDDGEYIIPIENKIVFTNGDFDTPYISRIVEVVVETQTRFDRAKEIIYDVETGRQGIREAGQIIKNVFGDGAVLQYKSGVDGVYGWADRKKKGRNRRTAINNYINQQYRKRNASKSGSNQSIIPSAKRESSISEEASEYILDTKEYREILEIADERFELAGRKELSPKAIDRLAGNLLKKSKSNYSRELLTERLTALFDYLANSRKLIKNAAAQFIIIQ